MKLLTDVKKQFWDLKLNSHTMIRELTESQEISRKKRRNEPKYKKTLHIHR